MAGMSASMDVERLANRITMKVKLRRTKQWRWRIVLGLWLIRLAAWVMWMGIDLETDW